MQERKHIQDMILSPTQAKVVARAYFSERNIVHPERALDELQKIYPKDDFLITRIGSGNNTNFKITKKYNPTEGIVVQLGSRDIASEAALAQFSLKEKPNWFAPNLTIQFAQSGGSPYLDASKDMGSMISMGICTPFTSKSEDVVRKPKHEDNAVEFACNSGSQISSVLAQCAENNILWTDLKFGNLLFNNEGQLVITDYKAFSHVDMLPTRANGTAVFQDITPNYISPHFDENFSRIKREDALGFYEKEYSFQLAMILYKAATNKNWESRTMQGPAIPPQPLDPAFQTEKGKMLWQVIERLSAADPNQRLHHRDATKLLAIIENKEEKSLDKVQKDFQKTLKEIEKKPFNVNKLIEKQSDKDIDPKVMREVVIPQRYFEFAKFVAENKDTLMKKDKDYSYDIALNIYNIYANNKPPEETINFKNPIFKGAEGKDLKNIIEQVMHDDVNKRLSLLDVQIRLKHMAERPTVAATSTAAIFKTMGKPAPSEQKLNFAAQPEPEAKKEYKEAPIARAAITKEDKPKPKQIEEEIVTRPRRP